MLPPHRRRNVTCPRPRFTSASKPAVVQALLCTCAVLSGSSLLHHSSYSCADFGRSWPVISSISLNERTSDTPLADNSRRLSGSYLDIAFPSGTCRPQRQSSQLTMYSPNNFSPRFAIAPNVLAETLASQASARMTLCVNLGHSLKASMEYCLIKSRT